jgi:lipopolysaccharide/colanic/teichoic acid biosynthesis glycosyltransferase
MMVDPGHPFADGKGEVLRSKTITALLSPIRETDIPGWYRENRILGVIYTELGAAATQTALTVLRSRMTAALQAHVPPEQLKHFQITLHCFPDDGNVLAGGPLTIDMMYPELTERDEARMVPRLVKRAMDIGGSSLALLFLAPLLIAIAATVRLSSPGPVLFRQERVGWYGVPFVLFKFRSMQAFCDSQPHQEFVKRFIAGSADRVATEQNGHAVYKLTEDPRVTRVGRILRRTSFDELPQLLNVLRGEMSLVGPRPPIPYEIEAYGAWHRRRLLEVKPGITGLWQVNGRSRVCFDDMVRLDLRYARGWSVWLDLKILLRTPRAVLFGNGAY